MRYLEHVRRMQEQIQEMNIYSEKSLIEENKNYRKEVDRLLIKVLAMASTINRQNEEIELLKGNPVKTTRGIVPFIKSIYEDKRMIPYAEGKEWKPKEWEKMIEKVFKVRPSQWGEFPITQILKAKKDADSLHNPRDPVFKWWEDEMIPCSEAMDEKELFTQHTFANDFSPCGHCGGLNGTITLDCTGRMLTDSEKSKISAGVLDFRKGEWVNPKEDKDD